MLQWLKKNAPQSLKQRFKVWRFKSEFKKHRKDDAPVSHLLKQERLYHFGKKYKLKTLVETGTYLGEMVSAMRLFFDTLYSIELSPKLAIEAKELFKYNPSIEIIEGDSAIQLTQLLSRIHEPTLFWLDGHYSGGDTALGDKECPILEELEAIKQFKCNAKSAILIDDARLFNGTKDYPKVETLNSWVNQHLPSHLVQVEYDAICIFPKN